jgi:hypothetical protein
MNESPAGDPNQKTIDNSFNPYPMDMQMPAFNTGGSTMPSSSLFDASDNTPSLDEIVRQIDAQIAKLEKEEAEAKRLEQDNKPFIDNRKQPVEEPVKEVITESVKEPKVEQVVKEEPKIEEIKEPVTEKPVVLNVQEPVMQETIIPTPEDINEINKEIPKEEKPIVNVDADSVVVNNNYITDDQFFDDFFSDD